MSDSKSLTGKTAIVTGASSGIGRAIAEKLGGAGAHVVLAGRTQSSMQESKARIEAAGGYAVTQPIHVNVSEIVVRPPKQLNL